MKEITAVGPNGFLVVRSMQEAFKCAEMIASSSLCPQALKAKPNEVLLVLQAGQEIGYPPMEILLALHMSDAMVSKKDVAAGKLSNFSNITDALIRLRAGRDMGLSAAQAMQGIVVMNGRPALFGDAFLGVILRSPECEFVEITFDKDTMTATCKLKRKGHPLHIETFSKEDAILAGLWDTSMPWKQYPQPMLERRALGFGGRKKFADVLKGVIIKEEAQDIVYHEESKYKKAVKVDEAANSDLLPIAHVNIDNAGVVRIIEPSIAPNAPPAKNDAIETQSFAPVIPVNAPAPVAVVISPPILHSEVRLLEALIKQTNTNEADFLAHFKVDCIDSLSQAQFVQANKLLNRKLLNAQAAITDEQDKDEYETAFDNA